uniref:Uncharacterized protein n=1 Tax=Tanacetum cinerariifolium TaxID=118510 RepID=A0A6L2N5E7_TANCI|nr:hypothetical protein [Tanacetum cinerariifolium]
MSIIATHNAIIEAGGKDRAPILVVGSYIQWKTQSRRYIATRRNHELFNRCINEGPYEYQMITYPEVHATDTHPFRIILTGIDNDIYSTLDACANAKEMWIEIESRMQATTRSNGKEIARAPSPPRELEHEVISDEEETPRGKEIAKLMALISISFKKIYKPTNNNLQLSSNTRNKNVHNTPRIDKRSRYERQTGQYKNQRADNVARNRDTVGNQVVQQNEIQCYSYEGFRHTTRKFKSAKKVKDSSYNKDKMMLCKQEEAWV